jgi:hypothetical protein
MTKSTDSRFPLDKRTWTQEEWEEEAELERRAAMTQIERDVEDGVFISRNSLDWKSEEWVKAELEREHQKWLIEEARSEDAISDEGC